MPHSAPARSRACELGKPIRAGLNHYNGFVHSFSARRVADKVLLLGQYFHFLRDIPNPLVKVFPMRIKPGAAFDPQVATALTSSSSF